jgi:hypothetical protein
MKMLKKFLFGVVAALSVAAVSPKWAMAVETFKPLHPTVQLVQSSHTITGATSSTSTVVDLSGGDLTSISCAFYVQSASTTGTPTLDGKIQISPDGTNWTTAGNFTQVTSTTTSVGTTYLKQDVSTGPGIKARLVLTGSANTSWIGLKSWCLPTVD